MAEFSLGLIEVSALGNAIIMADEMLKAADVEFVATERKLGGRLVTIVVKGSVSSVTASVAAGEAVAKANGCLKASQVIARPHPEIFKFLHLDEEKEAKPNTEAAATHVGKVPSEKKTSAKPKTQSASKTQTKTATSKTQSKSKAAPKTEAKPKTKSSTAKKPTTKK